jgi:hypothetical protein
MLIMMALESTIYDRKEEVLRVSHTTAGGDFSLFWNELQVVGS